ncbi:YraN family protein [Alcaligenaceae bacterium]|nr:YraN family protein [Alcaligenaceae bacterium]
MQARAKSGSSAPICTRAAHGACAWTHNDNNHVDTNHRAPAWSPRQLAGHQAEEQARLYLQARGLTIVIQNLRSKTGEIDLIAIDQGVLVFVEVRQRHTRQYGGAAASVNRRKQGRLIRTAQYYLPRLARRYFRGVMPACRFDVVSMELDTVTWIRNAFEE